MALTIEGIIVDFSYEELEAAANAHLPSFYCLITYLSNHDNEAGDW